MTRTSLAALIAASLAVPAAAWTLDGSASSLSYVSIKNADTAEANLLPGLSGGVDADGQAEIEIALSSVETYVDIRNERMQEHLFNVAEHPVATVSAALDMAAMQEIEPGGTVSHDFPLTVSANGTSAEYNAKALVSRLGEDRVQVTAREPVIVYAEDLGYGAGLETLREIAGLDSIQPAVPVTFTLVFTR